MRCARSEVLIAMYEVSATDDTASHPKRLKNTHKATLFFF